MAHHGYLELEGGHLMVEFLVRQCSLPDDPPVSLPAVLHRGAVTCVCVCGGGGGGDVLVCGVCVCTCDICMCVCVLFESYFCHPRAKDQQIRSL